MSNLIKKAPGMLQGFKDEAYLTMAEIQTGTLQLTSVKKGIVAAGCTASMMMCSTGTAYAEGEEDVFDKSGTIIDSTYGKFAGLITGAAFLVVIICALIGILGDDDDAKKAKSRCKRVAMIYAAVLLLGTIYTFVTTQFGALSTTAFWNKTE